MAKTRVFARKTPFEDHWVYFENVVNCSIGAAGSLMVDMGDSAHTYAAGEWREVVTTSGPEAQ